MDRFGNDCCKCTLFSICSCCSSCVPVVSSGVLEVTFSAGLNKHVGC